MLSHDELLFLNQFSRDMRIQIISQLKLSLIHIFCCILQLDFASPNILLIILLKRGQIPLGK